MPLPRFTRLPAEERRQILEVAQHAFATDGTEHASYNQIIAAAGISKSSAYNYFDGRDDLLHTVLDDIAVRLAAALGPWRRIDDHDEFWAAIHAAGTALGAHLAEHPDDLALIDPAFLLREQGTFAGWVADVVDNGVANGIVTADCDRDLLVAATAAVIRAGDAWAADQLRAGRSPDQEQPWSLVRNLWGARA
ncbi:TetR/AcrR family transcriptional regulator [Rhodococcus maanshanensis]|uniref:TetR/AcrR family transcriptional regulator n=1 Tax=Rhodococcus maanshanensis TaxID=183556 RepID=UPI0009339E9D|nr:TetR/AcrR family transcriptional regulator [Rhodococcus maanshanensis]